MLALSLVGTLSAGALGSHHRQDWAALEQPRCGAEAGEGYHHRTARGMNTDDAAFRSMDHPSSLGAGGSNGAYGCSTNLQGVGLAGAAEHHRSELPDRGWRITADSGTRLVAEKDGLRFTIADVSPGVAIEIGTIDQAAVLPPG